MADGVGGRRAGGGLEGARTAGGTGVADGVGGSRAGSDRKLPEAHIAQATHTPARRKRPGAQLVQAPAPVQAAHPTSQVAQVASVVGVQAAVR